MTAVSNPIELLQLANPVPPGSLSEVAAGRAEDLLARLRANDVATPTISAPGWRRRPLLVTAVVAVALALTGVAIADGLGAFNGISAANHPQTPADVLDPQTVASLQQSCGGDVPGVGYRPNCNLVLDSSRLVNQLPSGRKMYVVADTRGDLCVLLPGLSMSCGSELSRSNPITITSSQLSFKTPRIDYGVALDGVTAISFEQAGHDVTVPVMDNVWAYEGAPLPEAVTVHFDNGTTVTLRS